MGNTEKEKLSGSKEKGGRWQRRKCSCREHWQRSGEEGITLGVQVGEGSCIRRGGEQRIISPLKHPEEFVEFARFVFETVTGDTEKKPSKKNSVRAIILNLSTG